MRMLVSLEARSIKGRPLDCDLHGFRGVRGMHRVGRSDFPYFERLLIVLRARRLVRCPCSQSRNHPRQYSQNETLMLSRAWLTEAGRSPARQPVSH